jgi:hypothetical protein
MPYWSYDTICVDADLAQAIEGGFGVSTREVIWARGAASPIRQLVVPVVGTSWHVPDQLGRVAKALHGQTGATCTECGTLRWAPMNINRLTGLSSEASACGGTIMASPEWFGGGLQSFRHILVRRQLAEFMTARSPRDFRIEPLSA